MEDDGGGPIVVVGRRPHLPDLDGGGLGSGGSTGGGSTGGGGGGGGGTTTDPSQQQDCRDHRALDAQTAINGNSDDQTHEYGIIVYRGADGQVYNSTAIRGTASGITQSGITQSQITGWLNSHGVSMSQVIGFVHNHDAYEYGTSTEAANVNRYPSANDWNFATWMVSQGAGGTGGAGFGMYIIDTDGDLREFNYSMKSTYNSLTDDQKNSGMKLPADMKSDGSSC